MTTTLAADQVQDTLVNQGLTIATYVILGATAVTAVFSYLLAKSSHAALKAVAIGVVLAGIVGSFPWLGVVGSSSSTGEGGAAGILNTYLGTDITTTPAAPSPAPPTEVSAPAPAQPTDWTTVAIVGVIALAVLAAAALIFATWRYLAQRAVDKRAQHARRAAQIELWQQGLKVLGATRQAVMDFETDPESVYFTRRLLGIVSEPRTAAFYTALGTAESLCTDTIPADTDMITAFVEAANAARRAFNAADENARRKARQGIGDDGQKLSRDERRKIDQAQKFMRQAHDPALTEAHAHNAMAKALDLLDQAGVIVPEHLRTNVTKSIETIHRRALTG